MKVLENDNYIITSSRVHKDLRWWLDDQAANQRRSLSNLINFVLLKYRNEVEYQEDETQLNQHSDW